MKPVKPLSRADSAVWLISFVSLVIVTLPYLCGRAITAEGYLFSGFVFVPPDSYSYLAKMRQGFEGHWLYQNLYTAERAKPAALFEFYLFLGHLARWLNLDLTFTMHAARMAGSVLLLFSWDRLIRALEFGGRDRVLAFFIGVFGGGMCWLIYVTGRESSPVAFWCNEAHGLSTMSVFAHFAWSSALILVCVTEWFLWIARERRRSGLGLVTLSVSAFALAWVHPRLILTVVAVGTAASGLGALWRLWPARRAIVPLLVTLISGGAPMVVITLSYRGDPIWEAWARTVLPPFHPLNLVSLYGLMWPLAAWGSVLAWRSRRPWGATLLAWAAVGFILPWLPINSARRLIQGYSFPLAALSAVALSRGLTIRNRRAAGVAIAAVALFLTFTPILQLSVGVRGLLDRFYPWYFTRARLHGMQWIRAHADPDAVIICSMDTGLLVPAYSGRRVIAGHWAESINVEEKWEKDIKPFFSDSLTRSERVEILEKYGVDYLYYSGAERRLGPYNPATEPDLWRLAWAEEKNFIFKRVK